jgi:phosphate transport system permease protein
MADSSNANASRHGFLRRGEAQVWLTGSALSVILLLTALLIIVVMVNGLGTFWPHRLVQYQIKDAPPILGEHTRTQDKNTPEEQLQLKTGNRKLYGIDFRWIPADTVTAASFPKDAVALERMEYGNFYGYFQHLTSPWLDSGTTSSWSDFQTLHRRMTKELTVLDDYDGDIRRFSRRLVAARQKRYKDEFRNGIAIHSELPTSDEELAAKSELDEVVAQKEAQIAELTTHTTVFTDAAGTEVQIRLMDIVRAYQPNQMPLTSKISFYASKVVELFVADPRESNTEGGLFPAIFGTVMLVFLMSVFSFPLGVIAGIYLREYAKEGFMVRLVRIAVNNLAGVPSIVYGIFGLGFFVYGIGGTIDQLFFAERLPTPTFGTGGILWASLTLGLLTIPVVIVSTEEALGGIPQGIREGSLSLGATKFQTLWRVLLPMASPGIMTGFILAMARAAGEVAPLMITGVVKLAPALPIDSSYPFIHAERKFMHLGFHIYDIGFQSPNVEAAKPMVYVTTLLLILIVMVMSSLAIFLRNRMKKKYSISGF